MYDPVDVFVGTADSDGASNDAGEPANGALPAARANPVRSADLSLSAIGTYSALQAFLAGIEKSARLLDVRNIVVNGSDTGVYSYKVTIRLYWLR